MKNITTSQVVIIGAGLAALYAALRLAPRPVLMISPETLGEGASSAWAQGGVAAAMDPTDSPQYHARDTINAGAGIVDDLVAADVTAEAQMHIHALTSMGADFERTEDGAYVMSREAAHSYARVVRARGDQSGAEIMRALISQVMQCPTIQVLEGMLATGLDVSGGQVCGVSIARITPQGYAAPVMLRGAAYLLAGGGSAGLYALTTNPPRIRGQVIGMAARAGAMIADAEFVQFHPTAIDIGADPAPLATEALRGEGAWLINRQNDRFMREWHPDAELAPRDIVARAVYAQTQAGNRPMLDTRTAIGARLADEFPGIASICAQAGIDPVTAPIPVAAAAHYHMGGIATDRDGRASLGNLWVCGESASTGLHGANRLASNGLLEALVYARRCAQDISATLGPVPEDTPQIAPPTAHETAEPPDQTLITRLREGMTEHVGVLRDAAGLKSALRRIAEIEQSQPQCAILLNMTATATLIAAAALLREESRGAHYRTDFPEPAHPPGARSLLSLCDAMLVREKAMKDATP